MQTTQAANVVAQLYHDWITGLVLTLVSRKDAATAEQFVFNLFRRQHLEKFLPGLNKLNLAGEPHAVAAAKYHYFSNQLGGVKVEYLQESEQKAWVRYPPPRWIWTGTAICGIPGNVNRAMLRGWHAHNGVTLGNPRLGFVCTKTTVDGQPGLEGYYQEYNHDLDADQRLVFAPEEVCPPIRAADLPDLDSNLWPAERKAKAYRNYSMEYIKTALPVLTEMLGPEESRHLGRICALQIGMHSYDRAVAQLGMAGDTREDFAGLLATLLQASGDDVSLNGSSVTQHSWRLFRDRQVHACVFDQWLAIFEGLLSVHDRFAQLNCTSADGAVRFDINAGGPG
jgi:hypothetical protein